MLETLKKRWDVKSNYQLVMILLVFTLTGSSTLVVKNWIYDLLGIENISLIWLRIILYILIILPVYNILLLVVGFLLGQFSFFLAFEKKLISKFRTKKK